MTSYKLGGWRPDPKPESAYKAFNKDKFSYKAPSLYGDVDLRSFSSPRHNQTTTSTCVGQSVVKALEIKRIQKYGHDKHEDLSILDVYYGARDLMNPKMTNIDAGTHISLACDVLRRFGVCREKTFPFKRENLYIPPPILSTREAYLNKIHSHFKIISQGNDRIEEIILNLKAGNPVVFGTQIGENWFNYKGGKEPIRQDTKFDGGHAMVIVGYVNDLFIVENSWGKFWGEDGFAFVEPAIISSNKTRDIWVMLDGSETFFENDYTHA